MGYQVTLIFFWLDSPDLAIERVKIRVIEGGHDVPIPVIIRRYYAGLKNLFELYIPICDYWMIFNSSVSESDLIAEGYSDKDIDIRNIRTFETIKKLSQHDKKDNTVRDKIIKGLELTHKRLIQSKKERNLDLVIFENGKIIRIHARDLK